MPGQTGAGCDGWPALVVANKRFTTTFPLREKSGGWLYYSALLTWGIICFIGRADSLRIKT